MKKAKSFQKAKSVKMPARKGGLLEDLRTMIEQTKQSAALAVNTGLTLLYWRVGNGIGKEILKGSRTGYGQMSQSEFFRQ